MWFYPDTHGQTTMTRSNYRPPQSCNFSLGQSALIQKRENMTPAMSNYSRHKIVNSIADKQKTRPIAISRVLRAFSDGPTDRPTDRPTDQPTEWLIESRARD